jgi:hypothetical protein
VLDHHLTTDDMPLFTTLRMTAFGQAVIDIANDSAYDVACQRVGTGWGCFLPGSWDRLGCQSWDHPARLAEAGGGSSLTRRVMSFGTEVSGYGIQGGQRG